MADLTFSIASDTTAFDNGLRRGVIKPLEDADKAIEELGRDGSRSIEKLEDEMRDAQRDTQRFEREIKDVSDALTRVGRSGKDAGEDVDRGLRKGSEGLDEFKDEANSTAREAAASFDGSAESIGDAFQEVAANAFAGFGPAGAAAGIAAAVGLGVVFSEMQKQQEAADELKQAMGDMYKSAVEAGRTYIDEAQIVAEVNDILFNPDRENVYQQAKRDAEVLGLTLNDVLLATAGDEDELNKVREAGKQLAQEQVDAIAEGAELIGSQNREYGEIIQRYETLGQLHDENNKRAEQSLALEDQLGAKESANIERGRTASQERYEALARLYDLANRPPSPTITVQVDRRGIDEVNRQIDALSSRTIWLRTRSEGIGGPNR